MQVGANDYKIGRLSAVDSFHVARKLAPQMLFIASAIKSGEGPKTPAEFGKALLGLMVNMTREDADFCLFTCLAKVSRMQAGGLASPMVANGQLMFDDVQVVEMAELMWLVIEASQLLAPFVSSPSVSGASPAP